LKIKNRREVLDIYKRNLLSVLVIAVLNIYFPIYSSASETNDSIIVERNLFSPDREKWVMPDKKAQKQKNQNKDINDIVLSGTIVSEGICSAILSLNSRSKRRRRGSRNLGESNLYMEGEYIGGYLIRKIQESFVVLNDETSSEDFKIFLYDSNMDRTAVKTKIKKRSNRTSKSENYKTKKNRLTKRLEKRIKTLDRKYSRFVMKKADNDLRKIKKTYPKLSSSEKNNFRKMEKELELLKKKYRNK